MTDYEKFSKLLSYEPDTGLLRWKESRGRAKAGNVAGRDDFKGYLQVQVNGRTYRAHRVAWLLHSGTWPAGEIDHKDGDGRNNKSGNLRDVSRSMNFENQRKAKSNNKNGHLGVQRNKLRWAANITVRGIKMYLGTFDTPKEAHHAYLSAKREHHAGCTI